LEYKVPIKIICLTFDFGMEYLPARPAARVYGLRELEVAGSMMQQSHDLREIMAVPRMTFDAPINTVERNAIRGTTILELKFYHVIVIEFAAFHAPCLTELKLPPMLREMTAGILAMAPNLVHLSLPVCVFTAVPNNAGVLSDHPLRELHIYGRNKLAHVCGKCHQPFCTLDELRVHVGSLPLTPEYLRAHRDGNTGRVLAMLQAGFARFAARVPAGCVCSVPTIFRAFFKTTSRPRSRADVLGRRGMHHLALAVRCSVRAGLRVLPPEIWMMIERASVDGRTPLMPMDIAFARVLNRRVLQTMGTFRVLDFASGEFLHAVAEVGSVASLTAVAEAGGQFTPPHLATALRKNMRTDVLNMLLLMVGPLPPGSFDQTSFLLLGAQRANWSIMFAAIRTGGRADEVFHSNTHRSGWVSLIGIVLESHRESQRPDVEYVVRRLLALGAPCNPHGPHDRLHVEVFIRRGLVGAAFALLENDECAVDAAVLFAAVWLRNGELIHRALQLGAPTTDVDAYGRTPTHVALSWCPSPQHTLMLMAAGTVPTINFRSDRVNILQFALSECMENDQFADWAATRLHVLKKIMCRIDVNARSARGKVPLVMAAAQGLCAVVELLLAEGAVICGGSLEGRDGLFLPGDACHRFAPPESQDRIQAMLTGAPQTAT
jgi:hypothetical protein